QASCEAVRTVRRAEVLAGLATVADPAVADPLSRARLEHAARALHPAGRAWSRWLTERGDAPELRDRVREAVEARTDGAIDPAVLDTRAWSACTAPGSADCWAAVSAETHAARNAFAPPLATEAAEREWRDRWCHHGEDADRAACEASI